MKHLNESIIGKRGNSRKPGDYHIYFLNYVEDNKYASTIDEIPDIRYRVKIIRIDNNKIKRDLAQNFGLDKEGIGSFYRVEDAIQYAKNNIERVFKKSGTTRDIWMGIANSAFDYEWAALVGYINSLAGAKIVIIK